MGATELQQNLYT